MKSAKIIISLLLVILVFSNLAEAQKDSLSRKMSFDFGITRGKNINLWPVYTWRKTADELDLKALFSIYTFEKDYKFKRINTHFLPLYFISREKDKSDLRLLSLFYPSVFRLTRDENNHFHSLKLFELAPGISFFEMSRSAGRTIVQNNLFFFIWHKENNLTNKSYFVIFPLFWQFSNPGNKSSTLFPLFSKGSFDRQTKKYFAVTPLFWHTSSDSASSNTLFPLWWEKQTGKGSKAEKTNVLFPVYWSFKDSSDDSKVIFPVVWSMNNKHYHSLTMLPLFSMGQSSDSSRSHLTITPLFWHFRSQTTKRDILFPFWWQTQCDNGAGSSIRRVFFPVYWAYRDASFDNHVIFPVVWSLKNSAYYSFTFFPLFSEGKNTVIQKGYLTITPLFWHVQNLGSIINILFPFWWNIKAGEGENAWHSNVVFPVFWSFHNIDKDNKVLFPVIWKHSDKINKSLTVFPLFSEGHSLSGSENHLVITPLFWHYRTSDKNRYVLFPVWWQRTSGSGETARYSNVLFPFYWSAKNKFWNYHVLFPFVFKVKNTDYSTFALFPAFSKGHSDDNSRSHLVITPLFWQFRSPEINTSLLIPFWWKRTNIANTNMSSNEIIFPVYWSGKNEISSYRFYFPLLWKSSDILYTRLTVIPLFSAGHSPDNKKSYLVFTPLFWKFTDHGSKRYILFPFWWYKKEISGNEENISNVVFPFWWAKKDKFTSHKILFPFIWKYNNRSYSSFTLLPLFSTGRSADSARFHTVITPLYWRFRNPEYRRDIIFPFWWRKIRNQGLQNEELSNVLFPVYWSYKNANYNEKFILPCIRSMKSYYYHSFTFFPLFSYLQTNDKKIRRLTITPLYWSTKQPGFSRQVLFPFFWMIDNHIGQKQIESWKNRFIWWPESYQKKMGVLIPEAFTRNGRSVPYKSVTLFPLFSAGHNFDRSLNHLVITPLFWNFHAGEIHRNLLFPLYNYYTDAKTHEKKFNILYFLFRSKHINDQRKISIVWPLIDYSDGPGYKYMRLAPVIWYGSTPRSHYFTVQPFYYHSVDSVYESYRIFLELLTLRKYVNYKHSVNVLWKTVIWDNYANNDYEHRILYRLFANVKRNGKTEKCIFPFYSCTRESNGESSVSVLLWFFQSFQHPVANSTEFYHEDKLLGFIRIRSNYQYLKAKGFT
ncbi:MAG: hypothetical protein NTW49_02595, partial [Bacteroidia bacterium]|nr:hypothetical protein [Bacteroidia bacterium]